MNIFYLPDGKSDTIRIERSVAMNVINFFLYFLCCALLTWAFALMAWAKQEGLGLHSAPAAFIWSIGIMAGGFVVVIVIGIILERRHANHANKVS